MKACEICQPFNERDTTHFKAIGYKIHSALGLMDQYPQFKHAGVERLLGEALRAWHKLPVARRLTDQERAAYPSWNSDAQKVPADRR